MRQFSKKWFRSKQFQEGDNGIKVSELITLIEDNTFYSDIYKFLNLDSRIDDYIHIRGASTLVSKMIELKTEFEKIDLESNFQDISLFSNGHLTFNFNNTEGVEYFDDLGLKRIIANPIHSAKRDFFTGLYNMDAYASKLISNGHHDILTKNMDLLSDVTTHRRKYRLLHDTSTENFYLRGIVSTDHYNDYNINIAIVIGLITLHREMIQSDIKYRLTLCEYDESSIRMFFHSSETNILKDIGEVRNIVEISNDEIKRESLKFIGTCSINYLNSQKKERELILRPEKIKTVILSIPHNQSPQKAILKLAEIKNSNIVHKEIFNDISKVCKVKSPDQIRFIVKEKVQKAQKDELKKHKPLLLRELGNKINTIIELLEIFNKFNLIVEEDIEAKDYLRYLMYDALANSKS